MFHSPIACWYEMMMLQFDGFFSHKFTTFFSRLQHPRNIWLVSRWRRVTSYGSILPRREVLGDRLARRNPLHLSSLKWIQKIPSHGPLSCKLLLFFKRVSFLFHPQWNRKLYSCSKKTTTWIQISRQNRNSFFSNISHQIMIWLKPIVSR